MEHKDGFIAARPERILKKQTTHTPTFLGLYQQTGFWKESNFGKGVIIGVLDGGIFPSHPSFSDAGMPPPPAKWKGRCEFNLSDCNNKLIGARSFNLAAMAKGEKSEPPTDEDGHGMHTASTAAGCFVKYADVLGNAKGTEVGMAPLAHLAIYKVCFGEDCPESDMLAALDAAVEEGVDVLSLSIGDVSVPFFQDNIAIGSFAATEKGIFVSCSAGNSSPSNSTLSNEAPWILTVGASTIDRSLVATAKLGNGKEFHGESVFRAEGFHPTELPLVYAGKNGKSESAVCAAGSLKDVDVKDKIVLCERGGGVGRIDKGQEVKDAGGAAMILINQEIDGFSIIADVHVLPATHLSSADGLKIKAYINSTATPTATILFKGTTIGKSLAPAITSFSSRGPSQASPGILKPDIIGPGVNILAAWPFPLDNNTNPKSPFNIISGTSMSCPHLSGIAALLKSSHPYWSPAAIKSAIMTTADIVNLEGKAIDDETLHPADIFATEGELNYPSFAVTLGPSQTFTRTVTNVGAAYSTYTVTVVTPEGVYVNVKPNKIYFSEVGQKATYTATFGSIASSGKTIQFGQGFLTWWSTKYSVRSPIAVIFQ